MYSNQDPAHIKRVKKTAYKLNLPEEVIELTLFYTSEYIKKKISSIEHDYDNMLTEEEFNKLFPIIKIPYLGYLRPHYWKYRAINSKRKLLKEKK